MLEKEKIRFFDTERLTETKDFQHTVKLLICSLP
jgi:hypothetical protein